MTFNITNQNAGTINNVEGDQHVHGGQHGTVHVQQDLRLGQAALDDLRTAVEARPEAAADAATLEEVRRLDEALRRTEPDREQAASALDRLTRRLGSLGSLAAAGAALVEPIRALAEWLGPVAAGVASMLPL